MKKYYWLIGIITFLYLAFYGCNIKGGISSYPEDYSYFGSYLSGLSAIFSGVVLIILIREHTINKRIQTEKK